MVDMIKWGEKIFFSFLEIGDEFLMKDYYILGYGDVSMAELIIGSGLLFILSFKLTKFFTNIM